MKLKKIANNLTSIIDNNKVFYYSYETIVAFRLGEKLTACENVYSRTTGRHLNMIDDGKKAERLKFDDFQKELRVLKGV
jgi:hypothetical protein